MPPMAAQASLPARPPAGAPAGSPHAVAAAVDLASDDARRRPPARAALGGADPPGARLTPEEHAARGRRPEPPRRGHRGADRLRPVRRQADPAAAARLRPPAQDAALELPRRSLPRAAASSTGTPASGPSGSATSTPPASTRSSCRQVHEQADPPLRDDDGAVRRAVRRRATADGCSTSAAATACSSTSPTSAASTAMGSTSRTTRSRQRARKPSGAHAYHGSPRDDPRDRRRRLRRDHDVVGPRPPRRARSRT